MTEMSNPEPKNPPPSAIPRGFCDIEAVLPALLTADLETASAARTYAVKTTMAPLPAELLTWLAAWQGKFPPQLHHPRVILFAADHGVAVAGGSDTAMRVEQIVKGEAPVCKLAEELDADLRLYDLGVAKPTADMMTASAMSESECVSAIIYGMMAVEMGLDAIALSGMGQGSHFAAAVLAKILGHVALADTLAENQLAVEAALALHGVAVDKPLELLSRVGGREMAAMLGVMIAARMARTPVIIEGVNGLMTAALLHRLDKRAVQHCLYVGPSEKPVMQVIAGLGMMHVAPDAPGDTGVTSASLIPLLRVVVG